MKTLFRLSLLLAVSFCAFSAEASTSMSTTTSIGGGTGAGGAKALAQAVVDGYGKLAKNTSFHRIAVPYLQGSRPRSLGT